MEPIIIGVTGLPSAGKGLFCQIARNYGFKQIIMGDVIRKECVVRGLEVSRENSNKIMMDLRKERGENAIALVTLEWIDNELKNENDKILIDGIRSLAEIKTFRKNFSDLIVVGIHASPKTRLLRALQRKRVDDAFSSNEFFERDQVELSVGIGDVISTSDLLISSESPLDATKQYFTDALDNILKQKQMPFA